MRTHKSAFTVVLLLLTAACVPPPTLSTAPATLVPESKEVPPSPPSAAAYLYSDSPEIQEAVELYVKTAKAPVIKGKGFIQFPYGESEPLVTCLPLRACDVELEAGEDILNVALGDSERWVAEPAESGSKGASTPHVVIKPTDFDLASNALIFTTKRTYHVALLSPPDGMTPATYARRVRFYYPSDLVRRVGRSIQEAEQSKAGEVAKFPPLTASDLNFDYAVTGDNAPWRPVRAFDDGAHVYIQMPPSMRADEAPALMVATSDGETLVNYRVKGNFYVVDKLFDEASLIAGTGWSRDKVTIKYTGKPRS
jgi:type IV secretion system protein VirB9